MSLWNDRLLPRVKDLGVGVKRGAALMDPVGKEKAPEQQASHGLILLLGPEGRACADGGDKARCVLVTQAPAGIAVSPSN